LLPDIGREQEYFQMGARFAKWRAVIALGEGGPKANAQALAKKPD
jgi:fructose-bisphosphate aldolase, class I